MSDRARVPRAVFVGVVLVAGASLSNADRSFRAAAAQVPVLAPAPPSPWTPTDATQLRAAKGNPAAPRSAWKCGRVLVARAEHAARVGQASVAPPRGCGSSTLVAPYRVVRTPGGDELWRDDQRLAVLAGSGPPKPTPHAVPAVRRTRTTTREWTTWDRRLRARVHHREEVEEVLP